MTALLVVAAEVDAAEERVIRAARAIERASQNGAPTGGLLAEFERLRAARDELLAGVR